MGDDRTEVVFVLEKDGDVDFLWPPLLPLDLLTLQMMTTIASEQASESKTKEE